VYFLEEMLKQNGESLQGKKIAVSGFGNVAWGVCKKIEELGGTVITLSGPDGFIHDPEGIKGEKIRYMQEMRFSGRDCVEDYALHFKTDFHEKQRPWSIPCDIAIPCACENEMELDDAKKLVSQGCRYVCEAANMPLTIEAIEYLLENKITYAPGKAANAGGVACSGFEMMQNASRVRWSAEQVDEHLKSTMKEIHRRCLEASLNYGHSGNYMAGANIASFLRVANAMLDQGHI
jgi:glutamate dehydrogenase (NADP+)